MIFTWELNSGSPVKPREFRMPRDGWKLVAAAMQRRQQRGPEEIRAGITIEVTDPYAGLSEEEATAKRLAALRAKYVRVEDRA